MVEGREQGDPSLFGISLIQLFVAVLLFAALLQVRRDMTLLCASILALMGLARAWGALSLRGATLTTSLDRRRVFPEERLCLSAEAENARIFPVWLQVSPRTEVPVRPVPAGAPLTRESGLLWYQKALFRWELEATRRGVYRIGRARVRVADPLGFFPREKEAGQELELVVYPRRVAVRPIAVPHRDFFGFPAAGGPVRDPIHILGTRDYQYGHPARNIHWKASARHHRLQEKVLEPSEQPRVLFVLDVGGFGGEGAAEEFELSLEVLGSLALQLDGRGAALGFATNGVLEGNRSPILAVERNPRQVPALLELLARLRMEERGDLLTVLRRGFALARGLTCLHFGYGGEDAGGALRDYLSARGIPVVSVVSHLAPPSEAAGSARTYRLADLLVGEAA